MKTRNSKRLIVEINQLHEAFCEKPSIEAAIEIGRLLKTARDSNALLLVPPSVRENFVFSKSSAHRYIEIFTSHKSLESTFERLVTSRFEKEELKS